MNKKQVQDAFAKLRSKNDPDVCRSLAERLLTHLTGNKATRDSSGPSKSEVIAALQPHTIKQAKGWIKRIQGQAPGYAQWVIKKIKDDIRAGFYTWADIECSEDSLKQMHQRQLEKDRKICVAQHTQEILDLRVNALPPAQVKQIVLGIELSIKKGDTSWGDLDLTPSELASLADRSRNAYSSVAQKKAKAS